MKNRLKPIWQQSLCFAFFLIQGIIAPAQAADVPAKDTTISAEEAFRQGEAMYVNGVLPSGKPLSATVLGKVSVEGKNVSCVTCHLRSGLGTLLDEEILVLPVSGTKLFAPLVDQQGIPGTFMKRSMFKFPRPAYTDETLAKVLLTGIDPTGRNLDATMPRFLLNEDYAKVMVAYLKNLSAKFSPGVAQDEIRYATIITEDISAADRDAMLLPLNAFLQEEWNARLSIRAERSSISLARQNMAPDAEKRSRKASLDVWELHGTPETWATQLATFYAQRPVFAILGGIAPGQWSPIHAFCEKNKIPCIFPITDLPTLSESDRYTLYFSKGLYLEGEVAAKFLAQDASLPADTPVVQVSRNTDEGQTLALGFSETWKKLGGATLTNIVLSAEEQTDRNFWKKLSTSNPQAALVVWLTSADLTGIESLADGKQPPALFLSATLLGGALATLPDKVRDFTFIDYPGRLPGDGDYTQSIVSNWMKIKKIPVTNMTISSKIYFLKTMLSNTLVELGDDFYRDYFLDILASAREQATASISYPVLSFGPEDRYAAKGCYVVQLTHGENPTLIKKVDWLYYLQRK